MLRRTTNVCLTFLRVVSSLLQYFLFVLATLPTNVESALCAIEDRLPMRDPAINSPLGLQMSTIKSTQ